MIKERFIVKEEKNDKDNDSRFYGKSCFIAGFRFQINGIINESIREYENAVYWINRIEVKTTNDLKLLENYKERLREVITNKSKTNFTIEQTMNQLEDLYKDLAILWKEKINPTMTIVGHKKLKRKLEDHIKYFKDRDEKITGKLFISQKWK